MFDFSGDRPVNRKVWPTEESVHENTEGVRQDFSGHPTRQVLNIARPDFFKMKPPANQKKFTGGKLISIQRQ
jgi:hypothetical protein